MKVFLRIALTLLLSAHNPASSAIHPVVMWPIYQTMEADQNGSAFWVENRGTVDMTFKVRVLAWKQLSGQERYAAQRNVLANPSHATIPPGRRQLFRLIRMTPTVTGTEQAYRIIIDETPLDGHVKTPSPTGIHLQMRYLLPLFVYGNGIWTEERSDKMRDPSSAARPKLSWRIIKKNNAAMLSIRNQGPVHARLSNVFWRHSAKQATQTLSQGLLGYVLPGQEVCWPLPAGDASPTGRQLFIQLANDSTPVFIPRGR